MRRVRNAFRYAFETTSQFTNLNPKGRFYMELFKTSVLRGNDMQDVGSRLPSFQPSLPHLLPFYSEDHEAPYHRGKRPPAGRTRTAVSGARSSICLCSLYDFWDGLFSFFKVNLGAT
jgi:hypothetical protein